MVNYSDTTNLTDQKAEMGDKKLYIKTYGCQMNAYDSTRMADILAPLGYETTETANDADMVILNTCHIREKASEKVFSDLGRMRDIKNAKAEDGKKMLIAVAGCVAQAEGDVIIDRAKYVDMVFGPQTYHQLPEMVADAIGAYGTARIVNTDMPPENKFDFLPEETAASGASAFLAVQEGCDKFCTFCVVPYTRGAEYSRPVSQILSEAKKLIAAGAREITLLGQNVNAYHGADEHGTVWSLGRLIRTLAETDGLLRIRYTTSHPRDMDDDLIAAHGDVPQLMPYLHLPVQSGSDKILDAMNRKHTADDYRHIIDKVRTVRPDIALSSDFIVGFPGETDQDHKDTMKMIEDVTFASTFSFKYSARPGTPGANLTQQIMEPIKDMRLQEMQAVLRQQQIAFNQSCIGKTVSVLFDGRGNRSENQLHGKTPYLQSVHIDAPARLYGNVADFKITGAGYASVDGELVLGEFETTSPPSPQQKENQEGKAAAA